MPLIISECPHCQMKPRPCPFCGKPGKIFADNCVGCSDQVGCSANIDFGHWTGTNDDGTPAVHYVIEQWNKRFPINNGFKEGDYCNNGHLLSGDNIRVEKAPGRPDRIRCKECVRLAKAALYQKNRSA